MAMDEDNQKTAKNHTVHTSIKRKIIARLVAVQYLYMIEMRSFSSEQEQNELFVKNRRLLALKLLDHYTRFLQEDEGKAKIDVLLFKQLISGVTEKKDSLDHMIMEHLTTGWSLQRLPSVILHILRLALYEIYHIQKLDKAMVINEYIEITRLYNHHEEAAFVNGILDKASYLGEEKKGK